MTQIVKPLYYLQTYTLTPDFVGKQYKFVVHFMKRSVCRLYEVRWKDDRYAVPYLKRLVAGFPLRLSGFEAKSGHVGFVVDKVALRHFFPSTSVSPADSHSTDCSTFIIIYHPGLVQ
jgi:hypothetical protein